MTAGNMRANGVRNLKVTCAQPDCRHESLLNLDDYPDDTVLTDLWPRVACSKCGKRGKADVRPNWSERGF
jgi:hypothetical protein